MGELQSRTESPINFDVYIDDIFETLVTEALAVDVPFLLHRAHSGASRVPARRLLFSNGREAFVV